MAYVGAFVVHRNDPELYLVIGKVVIGRRVKLRRWSTGAVRTAKEEDIAVLPTQEAVESLKALIVSETPFQTHDEIGGEGDLLAAAYSYISSLEGEPPSTRIMTRQGETITNPTHCSASARDVSNPRTPTPAIVLHKKDFIREAVIAEVVASNLTQAPSGDVEVWGTRADLFRLIQVYCATAGVFAPTESLVWRRIREMRSYLLKQHAEGNPGAGLQNRFYSPRKLLLDIKGMEP